MQKNRIDVKSRSTTAESSSSHGVQEDNQHAATACRSSRHMLHCSAWNRFKDAYAAQDIVLGTGISGDVRQAKCRVTGQAVAVKIFGKEKLSERKLEQLQREVHVHLAMDHPHIARLDRVYESDSCAVLVMEKLEGGELFDRLLRDEQMDERRTAESIRQCLSALAYMHGQGFMHRDVKLENLMFSRRGGKDVKLIDFGFATPYVEGATISERCGTLHYCAPEVLKGSYDQKCDVWSVGVVAYMLLTGKSLYHGHDSVVRHKIQKAELDISRIFFNLTTPAQDFLRSLLNPNESKRMSAREALAHPWLTGLMQPARPPRSLIRQLMLASKKSRAQRACLAAVAWCLPSEAEEAVQSDFLALDADQDGVVSVQDLQTSMRQAGMGSAQEAHAVLEALDVDGNGIISFREALAAGPATTARDETLQSVFGRFQFSGEEHSSGDFVLGGVLGGVCDIGKALAPQRKDGHVSFSDFRDFLRGEENSSPRRLGRLRWELSNGSKAQYGCAGQQAVGGLLLIMDLVKAARLMWRSATRVSHTAGIGC